MAYNPNVSVIDYLTSIGQDSSYAARARLAASKGIANYTGTEAQNTQLLGSLKSAAAPVQNPPAVQTPSGSSGGSTGGSSQTQNNNSYVAPYQAPDATGSINYLRTQIKSGAITPQAALAQLQAQFPAPGSSSSASQDVSTASINAWKSALASAQSSLYAPMDMMAGGSKPARLNPDGSVTISGAEVKQSTTTGAGSSTSTTFALPVNITQNLAPGAQGSEVTALQEWLKKQGFFPQDQTATGYYGDITTKAVAAWQKSIGMNVPANEYGYFGPKSIAALAQYGVKTTATGHDETLFGSDAYKALPTDQQGVVKSIFDAVSSNDTDAAAKLKAALEQAKAYSDPYFKQQITIALDGLTRGFLSADQEMNYNVTSLQTKLDDLRSTIAESKDYLSLDQQSQLKSLEQTYTQQLETTQNDLAANGFGDSSRRVKTEGLLKTTKGDLVESTNRAFAQKFGALDTSLNTNTRDTALEIDRLRRITEQNKTDMGRKTEAAVGSSNLPGLPGYQPLGGLYGTIPSQNAQDILSAATKFIF